MIYVAAVVVVLLLIFGWSLYSIDLSWPAKSKDVPSDETNHLDFCEEVVKQRRLKLQAKCDSWNRLNSCSQEPKRDQ